MALPHLASCSTPIPYQPAYSIFYLTNDTLTIIRSPLTAPFVTRRFHIHIQTITETFTHIPPNSKHASFFLHMTSYFTTKLTQFSLGKQSIMNRTVGPPTKRSSPLLFILEVNWLTGLSSTRIFTPSFPIKMGKGDVTGARALNEWFAVFQVSDNIVIRQNYEKPF